MDDKKGSGSKYIDEKVTITVYTSDTCVFCKEALEIVKSTVKKCVAFAGQLRVIEENMSGEYRKVREDVNAVPAIQAGDKIFVGIPSEDDVKDLINHAMMFVNNE